MDGIRFDALARVLSSLADRRATARALAGGALGILGLPPSHGAEAKKKKKCKKPKVKCGKKCCAAGSVCAAGACAPGCTFVKTEGDLLWTLQADCTTTTTIEIPDRVTLDGNGKTIALGGPAASIETTGLSAVVRNLTLDGGGQCTPHPALHFNRTSGQIQDVSISDNSCGEGIVIIGTAGGRPVQVDVDNATLLRLSGTGIVYSGEASGTVSNSTVRTAGRGIDVLDSDVSVDGNLLEEVIDGVTVLGIGGAGTANVTNNTIVGLGATPTGTHGVAFLFGARGSVEGNAISNFFDSVGTDGCGIFVDADAGDVTIGTNTFPDPPGNEQNDCDNRP